MGQRLYVGNLSFQTEENGLTDAFAADGRQVASVTIMTDRETGRSRGFGFVEMASEDDAKKAIEAMDGQELDGRALRVNEAQPRPEGQGRGRGRGGSDGFRSENSW